MSCSAVAALATETTHPHIHTGVIHLISEQQALGFDDLVVANAFHLDVQVVVGFKGDGIGLRLGIELKSLL